MPEATIAPTSGVAESANEPETKEASFVVDATDGMSPPPDGQPDAMSTKDESANPVEKTSTTTQEAISRDCDRVENDEFVESEIESDSEYENDSDDERYKLAREVGRRSSARPIKSRKERAHQKMVMTLRYFVLVEDRIKELEQQVSELTKMPPPAEVTDIDAKETVKLEPTPLKMDLKEFSLRGHYGQKPTNVLEILTEEVIFRIGDQTINPRMTANLQARHQVASASNRVERIRITSKHISDAFESFGFEISGDRSELLRPFKPLFDRRDDLKQYLRTLESAPRAGEKNQEDEIEDQQDISDHKVEIPDREDTPLTSVPPRSPAQQEVIDHLRCLVNYMEEDSAMREYITTADNLRSRTAIKVSFENLWHLFAPGDIVFKSGKKQAYRVLRVHGGRQLLRRARSEVNVREAVSTGQSFFTFTLQCMYMEYNGKVFGPKQELLEVKYFEGECPITTLSVLPLQYKPGDSMEDLLAAGKRYIELAKDFAHREYVGLSTGEHREWIDSEVIVDFELYYQLNPDENKFAEADIPTRPYDELTDERCWCGEEDCQNGADHIWDDYDVDKQRATSYESLNPHFFMKIEDGIEGLRKDDQLRLLPTETFVYVLKARKWVLVDMLKIESIKQNPQNFDQLVLEKETRVLVESLVTHHARPDQTTDEDNREQDDLVRGKGKGVIILLHGAPGVGKTSTAECVAEATHRPLYPITCGDIGETAKDVQENLEKTFRLARRWGCVLLLDEADVFLQARDKEDMKRNAIVSVFLRILEYYSGILFLTTNKVGQFDEAFKSRIHISLYYPPLNLSMSRKVWELNIRRTIVRKPNLQLDPEDIKDWAVDNFKECRNTRRRPWNGRQIHNAFQTAIALAEYKGGAKLLPEHFDTVAKASKQFDDYMSNIHGPDAHRAKRYQDGYDDFGVRDSIESSNRLGGPRQNLSYTNSNRQPQHFYDEDDWNYGNNGSNDTPVGRQMYPSERYRQSEDRYRYDDNRNDDAGGRVRERGGRPVTPNLGHRAVSRNERSGATPIMDDQVQDSDLSPSAGRARVVETPVHYIDAASERGGERRRRGDMAPRDRERDRGSY